MTADAFAHIRTWVFDLDNTLYPPEAQIFERVTERMTDWVMHNLQMSRGSAELLRRSYRSRFGTTLAGLMAEHGVDPTTFLAHVHKIDLSVLRPDPALAAGLRALPGRVVVHTNADASYALKVLSARGLDGIFAAVHSIETTGFKPKPRPEAYAAVRAVEGFDPKAAAMFEDEALNLVEPQALGMTTIQVSKARSEAPAVQHWTDDLAGFLAGIA